MSNRDSSNRRASLSRPMLGALALALLAGGALFLYRAMPHATDHARYSGEYRIVGSLNDRQERAETRPADGSGFTPPSPGAGRPVLRFDAKTGRITPVHPKAGSKPPSYVAP